MGIAHFYGVDIQDLRQVVLLAKDTIAVNSNGILESHLAAEMESYQVFVKLTEEERRDRRLRIDLGEDAGLRIKVQKPNRDQKQGQSGAWSGQKQDMGYGFGSLWG